MVGIAWIHVARNSPLVGDSVNNHFFIPDFNHLDPADDVFGLWTKFRFNRYTRNLFQTRVQITTQNEIGKSLSYFISFFGFRYVDENGDPIPIPFYGTDFVYDSSRNLTDYHITNFLQAVDAAGGPNGNGLVPSLSSGGIFSTYAQVIPINFLSSYTKEGQVFNVYEMNIPINQIFPAFNPFDLELKVQVYPVDINANGNFQFLPSSEILSFTTYAELT